MRGGGRRRRHELRLRGAAGGGGTGSGCTGAAGGRGTGSGCTGAAGGRGTGSGCTHGGGRRRRRGLRLRRLVLEREPGQVMCLQNRAGGGRGSIVRDVSHQCEQLRLQFG
eukprot:jgi/Tetstr1/434106/TSEL_023250.t1